MTTERFTEAQIMQILKQAESGVPVTELCREHGIETTTFYNWRHKHGGMDASLISQMKSLAAENARIKRMYAEASMQKDLLNDALKKQVPRPRDRKELAKRAVAEKQASIRLACATFGISETCYRYERRLNDENAEIADWLLRLTEENKRWGFGLCFSHLRNVKGFRWNHKRVYRIYRELGLHLRFNQAALPPEACEAG